MKSPTSGTSSDRPPWQRRERYGLYVLALIFIILGIGLVIAGLWVECISYNSTDCLDDWWAKSLSEIGIAALIAGFLLGGSEWYLKETLFSEIETKISNTLDSFRVSAFDLQRFGQLPPPLQVRLRDRILGAPVIQTDLAYKYELSPVQIGDDKAYKAVVSSRSTFANLSDTQQRFTVKESLPASSFDTKQSDEGFQAVTSEIDGKGEFPSELVHQAIMSCSSSKGAGTTLFEREATLDPGSKLQIEFRGAAYLRPEEWIPLEAFLPTINMICVTSGADLTFNGQPGDALNDIWEVTKEDSGEYRWEIRGAVLPGQGFDIWFEEEE